MKRRSERLKHELILMKRSKDGVIDLPDSGLTDQTEAAGTGLRKGQRLRRVTSLRFRHRIHLTCQCLGDHAHTHTHTLCCSRNEMIL